MLHYAALCFLDCIVFPYGLGWSWHYEALCCIMPEYYFVRVPLASPSTDVDNASSPLRCVCVYHKRVYVCVMMCYSMCRIANVDCYIVYRSYYCT